MEKKIITGLTMGEPGGIASEITLKVWKKYRKSINPFVYIGNLNLLLKTNLLLKYNVPIKLINNINDSLNIFKNYLPVYEIKLKEKVNFGKTSQKNSSQVLLSIKKCVNFALKRKISCFVTNPIEKNIIRQKKKNFDGHTHYIANMVSTKIPVMMLSSPEINVVPITQHISLKKAIKEITKKRIIETTIITNQYLKKYFGIKEPKIALAALNPHASENGAFGNEEKKIIKPSIKKIRLKGVNAKGPYPVDTIFNENIRNQFDVIICMYHDQATMPIKILDFKNGVNLTLGMPIIRTSPDHGTALDIAGKGKASEKSLYAAIKKAQEIALKQKNWIR